MSQIPGSLSINLTMRTLSWCISLKGAITYAKMLLTLWVPASVCSTQRTLHCTAGPSLSPPPSYSEQLPLFDYNRAEGNGSFQRQMFQFLTQHLGWQMIADNHPTAADRAIEHVHGQPLRPRLGREAQRQPDGDTGWTQASLLFCAQPASNSLPDD